MKNKNTMMLKVDNISFSYNTKRILKNISFEIQTGTVCGLLGPNGSGKSTLFRCCMDFLKVTQGSIFIQNKKIHGLRPSELAKLIAYVPQEHKQPFPFLVFDMVLMGRSSSKGSFFGPRASDKKITEDALNRVGINHLSDTPFNRLSGGQRQLVLIARALAQQSPLMLLDEPASALDFNNQILLWKLLRELANDGIAIVVCSHDPNHILWFCDDALILANGELIAHGNPEELLNKSIFSQIYGTEYKTISIDKINMIYPIIN